MKVCSCALCLHYSAVCLVCSHACVGVWVWGGARVHVHVFVQLVWLNAAFLLYSFFFVYSFSSMINSKWKKHLLTAAKE